VEAEEDAPPVTMTPPGPPVPPVPPAPPTAAPLLPLAFPPLAIACTSPPRPPRPPRLPAALLPPVEALEDVVFVMHPLWFTTMLKPLIIETLPELEEPQQHPAGGGGGGGNVSVISTLSNAGPNAPAIRLVKVRVVLVVVATKEYVYVDDAHFMSPGVFAFAAVS